MAWPQLTDYGDVIQSPRQSFKDPELKVSHPKLGPTGLPFLISGNFAVVCEMRNSKQRLAVRCFSRPVTDQQRRYNLISQRLTDLKVESLVGFEFLPQGILVGGKWYPIVKMEWADGEPLNNFVERNLQKPVVLQELARKWRRLIGQLRGLYIAHGDLQHGNVLVDSGGNVKFVDYDGMFVPQLRGEKSPELGHDNFRHPKRTPDYFDETLDNFPALVVYVSLLALAAEPGLLNQFHSGENLILSASDYKSPTRSAVMQRLKKNPDPQVKYLTECLERYCHGSIKQVLDLEKILEGAPATKIYNASYTPSHQTSKPAKPSPQIYSIPPKSAVPKAAKQAPVQPKPITPPKSSLTVSPQTQPIKQSSSTSYQSAVDEITRLSKQLLVISVILSHAFIWLLHSVGLSPMAMFTAAGLTAFGYSVVFAGLVLGSIWVAKKNNDNGMGLAVFCVGLIGAVVLAKLDALDFVLIPILTGGVTWLSTRSQALRRKLTAYLISTGIDNESRSIVRTKLLTPTGIFLGALLIATVVQKGMGTFPSLPTFYPPAQPLRPPTQPVLPPVQAPAPKTNVPAVAQPLPSGLLNTGRNYLQVMTDFASEERGLNKEGEIQEAKRQIEEMDVKKHLGRGNRRRAREANKKGLAYQKEGKITEALRSFREANRADRGDVEVLNNLGYAYVLSGDLALAEESLTLALLLSPARASAWANLAQAYAKQGKEIPAVASFANTYRFSRDRNKTSQFLRDLAETHDDSRIRNAARKALQLKLLESGLPPEAMSLRQIIEDKLRHEGFRAIQVQEVGSDLILNGEVRSLEEFDKVKKLAEGAAASQSRRVNWARVKVVPESSGASPGSPMVTSWLVRRIIVRLQDAGFTQIRVEQSGRDGIRLTGEVPSAEDRDKVVEIANREIKGYSLVIKGGINIANVRVKQVKIGEEMAELLRRGHLLLDRGEYARAVSVLQKARELDPNNKEVLNDLEKATKAWDAEKSLGLQR